MASPLARFLDDLRFGRLAPVMPDDGGPLPGEKTVAERMLRSVFYRADYDPENFSPAPRW